jgi:hypothetical protein
MKLDGTKEGGDPTTEEGIDWSLTTWEGSRREQLRRWAELPLERAILALEEMETLSRQLQGTASTPSTNAGVGDPMASHGRPDP